MTPARPKDIRELARAAAQFNRHLESVKREHRSSEFGWYPYTTFEVFPILTSMLREERRDLLALAGAAPLLDVGCGDGGLSFFFESMGCAVKAFDHPDINFNRTRAVDTLRTALHSNVELELCDLDTGFDLRQQTYGLALFLGVLYHLKNPFGVLETLAQHVRYCLLSTRIAQVTARGTPISDDPVACLVDTAEANNDPTNFWIFSEAGLRRILDRTGWDVCDYATSGCQEGSDPVRGERDQRAYCMLRSKLPHPWLDADLAGGWHAMENYGWRWTERVFSVRLPRGSSAAPMLRLRFTLPEPIVRAIGPVRLQASVNGVPLPAREYASAGEHDYAEAIPPAALTGDLLSIRFELDKALEPSDRDARQLGVQVAFWSYRGSVPQPLRPIEVS